MKQCTKCKIEKPLSEFRERKDRPSGFYTACRKCESENKKGWYYKNTNKANTYNKNYRVNKLKDGYWYVYMLINANYYVGYTSCVYNRMSVHQSLHNRDTSDYIILHKCSSKEEALEYEAIYHSIGFTG